MPHAVAELTSLQPGQPIVFGGNRVTAVPAALAAAFTAGDRLIVVQETGDLLHVPAAQHAAAAAAVDDAVDAFAGLAACDDEQVTAFFEAFARRLADDDVVAPIRAANDADVAAAAAAGRSTTRLVLSDRMRADMVAGLRTWRDAPPARDEEIERIDHRGWSVAARRAPLGVVAFVFEGRPNVFADATGVVRTGNAVVMRIGSDALGTAEAIVGEALAPALAEAGLPAGTVSLVRSPARSAGWALFDDRRLALAVARGSGAAVAQLGAVARQAGTPVSLHGTGGAWLVAGRPPTPIGSPRRCSTPSTARSATPSTSAASRRAAATSCPCSSTPSTPRRVPRSTAARLHVACGSRDVVPAERFATTVQIERADGVHAEPAASELALEDLGREWEWERSPEVSLVVTTDVDAAVDLCNQHSPRFVASLVSDDPAEHDRFYQRVDAPFVGDGFTRWVDGQYALDTPELGLSNWQGGRLLGRGGVLSGRSVHTVRYRATVTDPGLHR